MSDTRIVQQGKSSRSKRTQNEAVTLDQAIQEYAPPEKQDKVLDILTSIDLIEFTLQRKREKLELKFHMVVSPRALIWGGGLVGVLVLALKLFQV
jgi:hypothetical protein